MSKSVRSFSDFENADEFRFTIVNGKMLFGRLYNIQNERVRYWDGFIELFDNKKKLAITKDMISIKPLKKSYNTCIYSVYGLIDGAVTTSDTTTITIGKNIDKINETTVLTQAMIQIRGLYLKKINSGYSLTINADTSRLPFVMALQSYESMKHKITYPCYIQTKLDGIRLSANMNSDNTISMLSRRHKQLFGFENIKKELTILFSLVKCSGMYTDGELYNHGMQLQDISSIVRQEGEIEEKNNLNYHIFDCFSTSRPELTFNDRYSLLKNIFDMHTFKYLTLTKTILINVESEGDLLHTEFVNLGYEGSVYKNMNTKYEFSFDKEKRSQNYLKRKKNFENEFKVVGFTQGDKGKGVGSIIFILETEDGKQFRSTPKMTLEERNKLYIDSLTNFDTKYKGKMATIRYDNLSNNNIPLRSNFITFRDYE